MLKTTWIHSIIFLSVMVLLLSACGEGTEDGYNGTETDNPETKTNEQMDVKADQPEIEKVGATRRN